MPYSADNMIKARKLVKNYGSEETEVKVLKGIDLEVKEGEFLAIMGRSGAGKSTLLYQLSLLDHPTSGEIIVDGQDISKLSTNQRTLFRLNKLGYVFQEYAILPDLTGIENVALPLLMQGYETDDVFERSNDMLKKVGLAHCVNKLPGQMSGGEQQRISVARAIAHDPKILFADEPTANLDNETASIVMDILQKLNCEGQTIVMVTHEKEYGALANRVIKIDDGIIVSDKNNKSCKKGKKKTKK